MSTEHFGGEVNEMENFITRSTTTHTAELLPVSAVVPVAGHTHATY